MIKRGVKMYGALIVAHNTLAREMFSVLENIVGKTEGIQCVSVDWNDDQEQGINKIRDALSNLKSYDGVVIFTDMFGGTPTNISLPFLEKQKIEIITGVNLPMLIKFVNLQTESFKNMALLLAELKDRARQSIKVPGEIYYQKKNE
jgi:PTS system mannose-specific IIA component